MKDFLININGSIEKGIDAKISVFDRGFLYGDSVYESTRTFSKKPFRIDRHIDRLFMSAEKISLTPTYTKEEILKEIQKTIQASPYQNVTLRIVLTRGTNSDLGLDTELSGPNNLIIFTKEIKSNPSEWLTKGVSMIFYQKKIAASGSLPKTGNYQENILGNKEAHKLHAYDAFLVNTHGHVTEGTTSNAWIIKNGVLLTPPLQDGVLDGLTRKTLIEMSEAHLLPLPLVEKSLTKEEMLAADECFITSTTRNIVPVTKIENQLIKDGKPGAITLDLLRLYLDFVK
ncbi:MAG: aminotransferase class IV [Bdellovibrionales bacterium]|nr:aminotransferase class IV [Bdellovibrionales bacterium]